MRSRFRGGGALGGVERFAAAGLGRGLGLALALGGGAPFGLGGLRRSSSSARSGSALAFFAGTARRARSWAARRRSRATSSGLSGRAKRLVGLEQLAHHVAHGRVGDRVRGQHEPHELDAVLLDDGGQHRVEIGAARVLRCASPSSVDRRVVGALGQRGRDRVLAVEARGRAACGARAARAPSPRCTWRGGGSAASARSWRCFSVMPARPAAQRLVVERGERDLEPLRDRASSWAESSPSSPSSARCRPRLARRLRRSSTSSSGSSLAALVGLMTEQLRAIGAVT